MAAVYPYRKPAVIDIKMTHTDDMIAIYSADANSIKRIKYHYTFV